MGQELRHRDHRRCVHHGLPPGGRSHSDLRSHTPGRVCADHSYHYVKLEVNVATNKKRIIACLVTLVIGAAVCAYISQQSFLQWLVYLIILAAICFVGRYLISLVLPAIDAAIYQWIRRKSR